MKHHFRLATPDDDSALRARMAADIMHGRISISFRREPGYFVGAAVLGEQAQVIVCETAAGQIIALGSRSTRQAYLNGIASRTGYLSDLRIAREARKSTVLARGFEFLRTLHEADPVALYSTVVLDGNTAALDALTKVRAGLPYYQPLGRMLTPAVHLDFPRRVPRIPGVTLRRASIGDLPHVTGFLQREHARRQFAPVWDTAALTAPGIGRLRIEDFWLAERGGVLLAALATWDQHPLRQTHIEAYSKGLARIRPLYNLLARLSPLKPMPAQGEPVPYLYISALAVANDDPDIFNYLLASVCNALRTSPWHYAICGLHESDPLAAVLADYRRIEAAGLLYVVHYGEDADAFVALDDRVPYVDFGVI